MLKVRIIAKDDCQFCKSYRKALDKMQFQYEIYDADDPQNDKELDLWKVTDLPRVQIIDRQEDGVVKVLYTYPYSRGGYSVRNLNYKMAEIEKNR